LAPKLIDATIAKFGRLDVLVNNAGMGSSTGCLGNAACMSEFDRIFKVNVRSVVQLTQLAVPHLEKTRGNVVNISAVGGMKPVSYF